jgi:hypothetical protein
MPTGINKSVDKGQTWKASQAGLAAANVVSLAVSAASPGVLYAAIPVLGLFRSANGGKTWTKMGASLVCGGINTVIVLRSDPDWLLASVSG